MNIVADTHLHLYPSYDVGKALSMLFEHFTQAHAEVKIGCLAEGARYHLFNDLVNESAIAGDGFQIKVGEQQRWLEVTQQSTGQQLYLLPGRQVITSENIEVLVLACSEKIPDDMPADWVIERARACNGVPVVAWSPGKWFGHRGQVVNTLIEHFSPRDFLIGDTTMRPIGWGVPRLMWKAKSRGFQVVAGSDPLPFAGEEKWLGAFRCRFSAAEKAPDNVIRGLLADSDRHIQLEGQRSTPKQLAYRLLNNAKAKKKPAVVQTESTGEAEYGHETPDVVTSSADYATRFAGEWGEYLLSIQNQLVEDAIPAESETVLELGGGHGQLVEVYRRRNLQTTIMGSTEACFGGLREADAECVTGDFARLPFPDQSFDTVVAVRLVMHLDHWQQAIAEMCRVAKKVVIIDYPAVASVNIMTPIMFHLKKGFEKNTRDYALFSHRQIREVFSEHGFHQYSRHGQFLMPMVVHRIFKAAAPFRWLEKIFKMTRLSDIAGSPVIFRADRQNSR